MTDITSKPYQPSPQQCCERCVFGRGIHAWWCPVFREHFRYLDHPGREDEYNEAA